MEELTKKFDVYALRPEPEGHGLQVYKNAQAHWNTLLGPQSTYIMEDPQRLVDCIIGLCSASAGHFEKGLDLIKRRQTPEQVDQVIETLHPHPDVKNHKRNTTRKKTTGRRTKRKSTGEK